MEINRQKIAQHVNLPVMKMVGSVADELHRECYVVGGYVRDIFLERPCDDMDFVTVGSGIEVAKAVAKRLGKRAHLSVFRTYGTAQVKTRQWELEFVGARRESYRRESRNPIVEDGTLNDDQQRRDFTINAMAICLNQERYGELLDPFDGIGDLERRIIRTPLDSDITFSDDPLRMMRAVRFATQLEFDIFPETFEAIRRNAGRIKIITRERIAEELMKIMRSPHPSRGWLLLDQCGLLPLIFPELAVLKGVETVNGRGHKDNFMHTLQVLDNVAAVSDNVWLRWAAVLHDVGKARTKRWDPQQGWTFHNHNFIGEKMVPKIFAKMRLPLNDHMKYVKKLVGLHMRPIALVEDEVTDSAVRRLLFDAGDDIDDLMMLCKADITSKNQNKVQRFRENFDLVKQKLVDIEEKDRVRNFQPPVDGEEIMQTFNLSPSRPVGFIKDAIKDAILDGIITNDYAAAHRLMLDKAAELGIEPIHKDDLCYTTIPTPIGDLTIAATVNGITFIGYEHDAIAAMAKEMELNPVETVTPLLTQCIKQLGEYFEGTRQKFSLPLQVTGTDFQMKAWEELQRIPYGETISYGEQAKRLGNDKASRAVAQANHNNPVSIVIPCHRVINGDGTLGGYASGPDKKQALLDLEKEHKQS
ncbi:MAG: methylated-DNA--[Muribaculaceae bacterium]|nr:methylated-DNA--[protein]-cysteine S-methyltransferase [Muribaculaceae bacterium]